jgi:Fic family protein
MQCLQNVCIFNGLYDVYYSKQTILINRGENQVKYKSFLKLFHYNKDEYEKRFKNARFDHCYHELDIKIGENKAFFFALPETYEMISEIENIAEELKILTCSDKINSMILDYMVKSFAIDEIKSTNNIEGINSSRKDINDVITKVKNNKRLQGMVNRYLMLGDKDTIKLSSSEDIRKIYDDLVSEEVRLTDPDDVPDGVIFRKKDVSVIGNDGKVLHRGLLPEAVIIETMDKALNFLGDKKVHYLIKIAVFHYLFAYIHPFYDGNGRVDRFISSYILSANSFELFGYRLSYMINKNLPAYYKAFQTVDNPLNLGDITPFIITFTEIIKKAANNTRDVLFDSIKRYKEINSNINKLPNYSEKTDFLYFILIGATLFSENGITKKELLGELDVSPATLTRRLAQVPDSLLNTTMSGNIKFYSLNYGELMRIINS